MSKCHVKYFIDGRKVADESFVDSWKALCSGVKPPYPSQFGKMKSGQNMVGDLTNINMYARILSDSEMSRVRL